MLGLFDWTPQFVRRYANLRQPVSRAVVTYADDVRGTVSGQGGGIRFKGIRSLDRPHHCGVWSAVSESIDSAWDLIQCAVVSTSGRGFVFALMSQ